MAEVSDNPAYFVWTEAPGNPDGYLYRTSTGQDGFVYHNHLCIPWTWPGVANEFKIQVQAARTNEEGVVIEVGPLSLWSDSVKIVPVPEPGGALLMAGFLLLCLLGRKRKH